MNGNYTTGNSFSMYTGRKNKNIFHLSNNFSSRLDGIVLNYSPQTNTTVYIGVSPSIHHIDPNYVPDTNYVLDNFNFLELGSDVGSLGNLGSSGITGLDLGSLDNLGLSGTTGLDLGSLGNLGPTGPTGTSGTSGPTGTTGTTGPIIPSNIIPPSTSGISFNSIISGTESINYETSSNSIYINKNIVYSTVSTGVINSISCSNDGKTVVAICQSNSSVYVSTDSGTSFSTINIPPGILNSSTTINPSLIQVYVSRDGLWYTVVDNYGQLYLFSSSSTTPSSYTTLVSSQQYKSTGIYNSTCISSTTANGFTQYFFNSTGTVYRLVYTLKTNQKTLSTLYHSSVSVNFTSSDCSLSGTISSGIGYTKQGLASTNNLSYTIYIYNTTNSWTASTKESQIISDVKSLRPMYIFMSDDGSNQWAVLNYTLWFYQQSWTLLTPNVPGYNNSTNIVQIVYGTCSADGLSVYIIDSTGTIYVSTDSGNNFSLF